MRLSLKINPPLIKMTHLAPDVDRHRIRELESVEEGVGDHGGSAVRTYNQGCQMFI